MKFTVLSHRDQNGLYVLGSLEEIFLLLEDNQVTLQTMLGSRFVKDIQVTVKVYTVFQCIFCIFNLFFNFTNLASKR